MTDQEKVDTLLEKKEKLIDNHMNLFKENVQPLTKEGELISDGQETDNNEMKGYILTDYKVQDETPKTTVARSFGN